MAFVDACRWSSVLLGLAACAGAPAAAGARQFARDEHRIAVRIEFEPVLPEPGELEVAHECGERFVVATARTGVDLRLRPGPAALTLQVAGVRRACALRILAGMPPVLWHLDAAGNTPAARAEPPDTAR